VNVVILWEHAEAGSETKHVANNEMDFMLFMFRNEGVWSDHMTTLSHGDAKHAITTTLFMHKDRIVKDRARRTVPSKGLSHDLYSFLLKLILAAPR
jgi:hypothetical protein